MQAMIDELAKQAAESLGQVSSKETLASFWQEYLSKNGKIPALMKNLRSVAPEERPAMGKIINELKQKVQADYDAAAAKVKEAELAARNAAETVDITLPAKTRTVGGPVSYTHLDVYKRQSFWPLPPKTAWPPRLRVSLTTRVPAERGLFQGRSCFSGQLRPWCSKPDKGDGMWIAFVKKSVIMEFIESHTVRQENCDAYL